MLYYHLEDGLVDLGAAVKGLSEKAEILAEKERKFKGESKKLVLGEKSPINYAFVRNASCLAPTNIIWQPEQSCICFRVLFDQLYSLNKISSSVADMSKNHYEELLKMAKYKQKVEFFKPIYNKDQIDVFLGDYISFEEFRDLWYICKIILVYPTVKAILKEVFL